MKFEKNAYADQDFSKEIIQMEEISHKKFTKCVFRWTDFADVEVFYGSTFEFCDFTYARLNGINIANCAFLNCTFKATSFFATKLDECRMTGSSFIEAECESIQICGGDWSYTDMRKLSFHKQDLSNVRFFGADLTECHFNQCKMNGCEFDEAVIHNTSFYKSDLRHSSIERIDLLEASFREVKLDIEQCVAIAEFVTGGKYTPDSPE